MTRRRLASLAAVLIVAGAVVLEEVLGYRMDILYFVAGYLMAEGLR